MQRQYTLPEWGGMLTFVLMACWAFLSDGPVPAGIAIAIAGIALCCWVYFHRLYRRITDAPLVEIGTAPQGFASVVGRGRVLEGVPLRSPLTYLPCLWYYYKVEERDSNDRGWTQRSVECSDSSFVVADATGEAFVDSHGANVVCSQEHVETDGQFRYTLRVLAPGQRLFVQGYLSSRTASVDGPSQRERLSHKLATWKQTGEAQQRFDLDRNGELDMQEWELARAAAQREVRAEQREDLRTAATHYLQASPDGRQLLISDLDPRALSRRYQRHAWLSLAVFFGLVAWAWKLYQNAP
ncbi:MAG: hypothetical protein REI94_19730 [Moraxellaceae bacterium]|nr:hypothetical protein [Moraxellaceae bacterium]